MSGWGQHDVTSEAHFRSLLTLAKPACAHEGSVFCCSACRRRRLPLSCLLVENDCTEEPPLGRLEEEDEEGEGRSPASSAPMDPALLINDGIVQTARYGRCAVCHSGAAAEVLSKLTARM